MLDLKGEYFRVRQDKVLLARLSKRDPSPAALVKAWGRPVGREHARRYSEGIGHGLHPVSTQVFEDDQLSVKESRY